MMDHGSGHGHGHDQPATSFRGGPVPPAQELERSSSFARSFFQSAGQDMGDLEDDVIAGSGGGGGAVDDNSISEAIHRSMSSSTSSLSGAAGRIEGGSDRAGMPHSSRHHHHQVHVDGIPTHELGERRRPRRRSSRGSRSGSNADLMAAAAATAAADTQYGEGGPSQTLIHQGGGVMDDGDDAGVDHMAAVLPRPSRVDRQTSWYTDALLQGGGAEDLSALLGQVPHNGDGSTQMGGNDVGDARDGVDGATGSNVSDDDEVLEQYRIMAHVEACIRVKDNTGFDIAEYEKRRKTQPEPNKGEYYTGSKKPKPTLPEPKGMNVIGGGASAAYLRPQEPRFPSPRINYRFIQHARFPKVHDLCPGIVIRNTNQAIHIPEGEHAVRCLGCQSKMRVNLYATMVQCPECKTISPARSTR